MDAIRKTVPETMAMQCSRSSERPAIDPAIWRDGRSPGEKTVGASTNAKKINPPSQTTSDKSMRKRRNDMSEIIEAERHPSFKCAERLIHRPNQRCHLLRCAELFTLIIPHPCGRNHLNAAFIDRHRCEFLVVAVGNILRAV